MLPIAATTEAKSDPIPARVAAELSTIENALHDDSTPRDRWGQLYAAQQALLWAFNENLAAGPSGVIMQGLVQPPTDIPVG